jgi:hypothetical protein
MIFRKYDDKELSSIIGAKVFAIIILGMLFIALIVTYLKPINELASSIIITLVSSIITNSIIGAVVSERDKMGIWEFISAGFWSIFSFLSITITLGFLWVVRVNSLLEMAIGLLLGFTYNFIYYLKKPKGKMSA